LFLIGASVAFINIQLGKQPVPSLHHGGHSVILLNLLLVRCWACEGPCRELGQKATFCKSSWASRAT
jgi:hypothetical protein